MSLQTQYTQIAHTAATIPTTEPGVRRIKAHPNYTEAMGEALGIIGPDKEPHNLSTLAPDLSLRTSGGQVEVVWNKNGMEAVEIQKDTGTGWQFLATDTRPNYIAPLFPPPPPSGNTAPSTPKTPRKSDSGATPRRSPWGDDSPQTFHLKLHIRHETPDLLLRLPPRSASRRSHRDRWQKV